MQFQGWNQLGSKRWHGTTSACGTDDLVDYTDFRPSIARQDLYTCYYELNSFTKDATHECMDEGEELEVVCMVISHFLLCLEIFDFPWGWQDYPEDPIQKNVHDKLSPENHIPIVFINSLIVLVLY